jgi:hypothetical protein
MKRAIRTSRNEFWARSGLNVYGVGLFTALVLICSIADTPDLRDCTRDNATAVLRVPDEFANPTTCFIHGQAYLATTIESKSSAHATKR